MKYAMMGAGVRAEVGRIPPAEQERRIRCHQQALNDLLRARVIAGRTGLIFVSVGLGPFHGGEGQTLSVRNREGKRFRTDGPFPETKEVVGGFDIIDFASREEAIEFGKIKNMHATHIEEIRPIREFWWISHSPKLAEANIFMLSSVEDGRGASDLSPEERKKLIRQHQAVGAEYVTQRGMVDGKPGALGRRAAESTRGGSHHPARHRCAAADRRPLCREPRAARRLQSRRVRLIRRSHRLGREADAARR
jgi:hypothetical protein